MAALVEMLGDSLMSDPSTTCATADALKDCKAVALYFSAHWCPPCRGFTPDLADAYTKALKAKGLEVVFVSSDKSKEEFDGYFGSQPWLALPYDKRAEKAALSKKFKVQGIPTLVILDGATGETITTEGREAVASDWAGDNFPWRPPTFWEALGTEFLSGTEGDTVDVADIKGPGKVIGLYFSAHWCPPCRGFTPDLIKAYKEHLKDKQLEIIFVSSDKSQAEFLSYYETMPWLAIPNGDKRKNTLSTRFGVRGIPSFVLVDGETGETITTEARGKVSADPTGADFPWVPKPLVDMTSEGPGGINEETALCVMLDGCSAEVAAKAVEVLEPIAAACKAKKEELLFFYAPKPDGICDKIRELTKVGSATATPQMLLLDIPDEGGYYVSPATEVTADSVTTFLEMYRAKALERLQLG